jgi:RNA polymerase sigma-70 factor (ECF subfamily)
VGKFSASTNLTKCDDGRQWINRAASAMETLRSASSEQWKSFAEVFSPAKDQGGPALSGLSDTPSAVPQMPVEQLLGELRPRLHRYCARMTGSVVDGEDVVQEALLKAMEAAPAARSITNPEGWLFRIAHHAALDFLRRRAREEARYSGGDPDMVATVRNPVEERQLAESSLRVFMRLPAAQRSSVILSDVLGHSLQEIGEIVENSVPAVKAALQRGRARLRALAAEADDAPLPDLAESERTRLKTYVDCFNAHDFDAIRAMLAEDVRLEVVNRLRLDGRKDVAPYFSNYAARPHWRFIQGFVDRRPAVLVYDADDPDQRVKYFVLLTWADEMVVGIRDFVFARYAMDGADIALMD